MRHVVVAVFSSILCLTVASVYGQAGGTVSSSGSMNTQVTGYRVYSWLQDNKDWVFSGIGVSIIIGLTALMRSSFRRPGAVDAASNRKQVSQHTEQVVNVHVHAGGQDRTSGSNGSVQAKHPATTSALTRTVTGELPGFIVANALDAMRSKTGVRPLTAAENELTISELARGVFGYAGAYSLQPPPFRVINPATPDLDLLIEDSLTLSSDNKRAKVEVHKSESGQIYIVACVSDEIYVNLLRPKRTEVVRAIASFYPRPERNHLIAIPRERLKWWRSRTLGDGEDVADIHVQ